METKKKTGAKKEAKTAAKPAAKAETNAAVKAEAKAAKTEAKEPAKAARPKAAPKAKTGETFNATIVSFRRSRHAVNTRHILIRLPGVDSKMKASQFIGRKAVWTSPGKAKKKIYGRIASAHGGNGVMRAIVSKGLPGTAIGTQIQVLG
jgi:ribosomal protein L35AE/L33A